MKNLKNTISAAGLMAVMAFGAVSANAGLIITDKTANTAPTCSVKDDMVQQLAGIFNTVTGIIITDRDGIIIVDKQSAECVQAKDGIIITDRDGLIITD